MMIESHKRTLVRMLTYRLTAWLLTIPVMYWLTGDLGESLGSSVLIHALLSIDYYFHERAWLKIKWGMVKEETVDVVTGGYPTHYVKIDSVPVSKAQNSVGH